MSTERYLKIKKLIDDADAIIIGAGAGLSTSAGVNYGTYGFKENFPELAEKYGFTDFYTSSFYDFDTEEERWSYWAKHIDYLCTGMGETETYKNLYHIFKNKNYFVITTNADKQFEKNGFDKDKIFEVQGTLTKIQCSRECHDKLYDDVEMVKEMRKKDKDCRVPTRLVPYCPKCGEKLELNLRKDRFFVEDEHWHNQNKKYQDFINDNKDKKLLFIEFGAGYNTPGIIRYPFEELTYKFKNAHLIRVNLTFADVPEEIQDKSYSFCEDINSFIKELM